MEVPQFIRMMILLLPNEQPPTPTLWGHDPPEGYRWETDEEFRKRIKEALEIK